ncbi:hypothetical protein O181_013170 [Austropuccinia psidii MF-1]|uniref:Reverse transcriptase Ty1/copia-type domain-containing protein n=1 Tax=Austropuccinia psidii MF-1 TaxID=1389203 RepID=A0A9Q3GNN1_9BASI|nr:hypothetical protein [Austropuccinia psidii MF-1]
MSYQILRLADLKVTITRNAIFNESIFPHVNGGKSKTPWNVKEVLDQQPFYQSTDNLPLPPTETNSPTTINDNLLTNIIQQTTDENINSPDESTLEQTDSFNNESITENTCQPILPIDEQQTNRDKRTPRLKVIGPCHPTIITGDIDPLQILPYSRRPTAYLTKSEETPSTYHGALKSDKSEWIKAIGKELSTMDRLHVWDIIDLKKKYKLVGTTWVFKLKRNHLNQVIEHKARLCAQGFTQTPWIYFNNTYALTGHLNSLRALIAHACINKLDFHQIDIKGAFLNAPLNKTVYLSIPQGLFIDCRQYCLRLKKAIYSLKQATLAWYTCLKLWLQSVGFMTCKLDTCVFHRKDPEDLWIYVHVNDFALFGKNLHIFKKEIHDDFDIKDMGPADLLLGVNINQQERKLP